jgi:hypothetical protein
MVTYVTRLLAYTWIPTLYYRLRTRQNSAKWGIARRAISGEFTM